MLNSRNGHKRPSATVGGAALMMTRQEGGETMNPNWTDLFKANLVKPAWAYNAKETEIPFIAHAIDSCIGTNWRKDGNSDEQLFSNSDRNRPGHRQV